MTKMTERNNDIDADDAGKIQIISCRLCEHTTVKCQ